MAALSAMLAACVLQAASVQALPPELLLAIIQVEGGSAGAASVNRNRTEDLGVMQINTGAWLDLAARAHFAGDRAEAYRQLRDDTCYNVQVGAWILRRAIDEYPGDVWRGVGRYHSATPALNARYQRQVQAAWRRLFPR
ncbi:MAG: lytic transglycosylase domain-containing protein [Paludibacterium sp.]|uniref:lytic transglycosylase domain-containing protein n=1 Tax=Paludibacterium sp. TaxID=1917523 RepID=UPI0025DCAA1E|nr:lytic transglycosylase domain-containing protein [Paludibacterium sp.]MBV8046440.1 lytic transglycosylase domain-containing protein [Paludibacterium sp.]MBV8645832.1 lytic transglycosylase domain-containing protein [Paludibacterium sp.]